jgi:hypothetical protein
LDADTRARLISLGIDPDKQEVPSSTAPTLADHLTALAELLKPAVAPEAAPLPAPVVVDTPVEVAPAMVETVATPEPTPAQVAIITPPTPPYRPIEQVYTPLAVKDFVITPQDFGAVPVKAADAEPFADPVIGSQNISGTAWVNNTTFQAPAPVVEPVFSFSPSGRYLEGGIEYESFTKDTLANDPQVVEFKKNHMATQVDGNHYVKCAIQPLDYIMANKLGFVEGNIVKYATRWQDKDGVVDLKKARDYLDKLIAYVESAS